MDQKERVICELEMENRAAYPEQKFPRIPPPPHPPPLGNFCRRCLNVGFFYNQPQSTQSTLDASVLAEDRSHKRRSSWSLYSIGYGSKELFRVGRHKDLSETRNSAWKVSCTQSIPNPAFRVAVKSRIPLTLPLSRCPHCILSNPGSRE